VLGNAVRVLVRAAGASGPGDHADLHDAKPAGVPLGALVHRGGTSRVLAYLFPREAAVFESCAEELAKSRWWSKIHYTWDNNDGLKLGRGVADKVIAWARGDGA
jgi:hypothetical protein